METSEILALHHRQIVDRFIESALAEMDLTDLERNVAGVALRREVETGLVPGLVAVQAAFHAADAVVLGKELPEWLDRVSSVIPLESQFFTEMGRALDSAGYDLMVENLGLRDGESEVSRVFESNLCEIAPCLPRRVAP